jgi:hypothetical protein
MDKGANRGPVSPDDPRDFAEEALEEVYDAWWYLNEESLRCDTVEGREELAWAQEDLLAVFSTIENYRRLRDGR